MAYDDDNDDDGVNLLRDNIDTVKKSQKRQLTPVS
jgi:hypothetical protein